MPVTRYFRNRTTGAWYEGKHSTSESVMPPDPGFIARLAAAVGVAAAEIEPVDVTDGSDPRSALRFAEPPPPAAPQSAREQAIADIRNAAALPDLKAAILKLL